MFIGMRKRALGHNWLPGQTHKVSAVVPSTRVADQDSTSSDLYSQQLHSCACGGGCPACLGVQAKLKVNPPGDRYEEEADKVADRVMRTPAPVVQRAPT